MADTDRVTRSRSSLRVSDSVTPSPEKFDASPTSISPLPKSHPLLEIATTEKYVWKYRGPQDLDKERLSPLGLYNYGPSPSKQRKLDCHDGDHSDMGRLSSSLSSSTDGLDDTNLSETSPDPLDYRINKHLRIKTETDMGPTIFNDPAVKKDKALCKVQVLVNYPDQDDYSSSDSVYHNELRHMDGEEMKSAIASLCGMNSSVSSACSEDKDADKSCGQKVAAKEANQQDRTAETSVTSGTSIDSEDKVTYTLSETTGNMIVVMSSTQRETDITQEANAESDSSDNETLELSEPATDDGAISIVEHSLHDSGPCLNSSASVYMGTPVKSNTCTDDMLDQSPHMAHDKSELSPTESATDLDDNNSETMPVTDKIKITSNSPPPAHSATGGKVLSTWKVNVGSGTKLYPANGQGSHSLLSKWTPVSLPGPITHQPLVVYDRTPHPSLTGKYVTPCGPQPQCSGNMMPKFVTTTQPLLHPGDPGGGGDTPGPFTLAPPPLYQSTPLQTLATKQLPLMSSFRTPRFGALNLNSSGSEDNASPPDYVHKLSMAPPTPYNTPVESAATVDSIPTAGQLNAALFRAKESLADSDFDLGRQAHNAKERARRARIKLACEHLRDLVPGMTMKTDKATVFEFAVQYIMFLKRNMITSNYEREFLRECSPY